MKSNTIIEEPYLHFGRHTNAELEQIRLHIEKEKAKKNKNKKTTKKAVS